MEIREGFIRNDIGIIPKDWEIKNIGSICEIYGRIGYRGYTIKDIMPQGEGAITISPSKIQDGKMNFSKCTYISWFKYDESPEIKIYNGDILLVKTGSTFGKTAIIKNLFEKATINPQLVVLKNIKVDNIFLGYIMAYKIVQNQIKSTIVGGAIPTLSQQLVANYKVPLPPSKLEQNAISKALSDADALINTLEKIITKKKNIKQGAMHQLLKPKKGWIEIKLGDIAEIYQPETISQNDMKNDGYFVYGANGIVGYFNKFNHETWQTIITCRGSTCGTINKTNGKAWITGNAMVMNVDKNSKIDKSFFYYLLTGQDFTNCITGSGQPQIVRKPLFEFKVSIPSKIDEQKNIATILSDIDEEIALLENKLSKNKLIKQGMMQNLLTGKIRLV